MEKQNSQGKRKMQNWSLRWKVESVSNDQPPWYRPEKELTDDELNSETKKNIKTIYCIACNSKVLLPNTGTLVEKDVRESKSLRISFFRFSFISTENPKLPLITKEKLSNIFGNSITWWTSRTLAFLATLKANKSTSHVQTANYQLWAFNSWTNQTSFTWQQAAFVMNKKTRT